MGIERSCEKAHAELRELVAAQLPVPQERARPWASLCLRRDMRALERLRPEFGITDVPVELAAFREFDAILTDTLRTLDAKMMRSAKGLAQRFIWRLEGGASSCGGSSSFEG